MKELHESWSQNKEVGIQVFENLSSSSSSNDGHSSSNDEEDFAISPPTPSNIPFISHENQDFMLPNFSGHWSPSPSPSPSPSSSSSLSLSLANDDSHDPQDEQLVDTIGSLADEGNEELQSATLSGPHAEAVTGSNELTITTLNIKMPPKLTKRGRPKGSEKTNVIGLPKKKNAKASTLTQFVDMKNSEKEKRVLCWCVGEDVSKLCLESKKKVTCETIDPTEISSQLYNEFVNIHSVSYWFEEDAWDKFEAFYNAKSAALKNRCSTCSKTDALDDDTIHCDHCLVSYHHACGRVKKTAKRRHQWFCNTCKIEFKS